MPHFSHNAACKTAIPVSTDVVVVGAGMAGLFASWRLLNETNCQDLVIIDGANRTGGRLDSDLVRFKDGNTVKEEEGGMRFTFKYMDNLMALFCKLGITKDIVPFPMNSGGNNRRYFRGESFNVSESEADNYAIWSKLYNLKSSEKNINPSTMIDTVYNRILAANPAFTKKWDVNDLTPEYWQALRLDCSWQGTGLNQWSLWDLFMDMGYSNESVTLLYRLTGFNGTFLSRMNAGEAFQLLKDFPDDPQFKTLKEGFSTLPNTLVDQIGREKIFLKTRLENIEINDDPNAGKKYKLYYRQTGIDGKITDSVIEANKIILAMPRLALEKLFVKANVFNRLEESQSSSLWDTLSTSTNQALLKINLYYDKAWWDKDKTAFPTVEFGPNFSDLPTGSIYPFYSLDNELTAALEAQRLAKKYGIEFNEQQQKKIDEINQSKYDKPAALTIYCDYLNINFWSALQNTGPEFSSDMQQESNETKPQTIYAASQAVVKQASTFFKEIFNTSYIPEPVFTSARVWQGSTTFDVKDSEQFGFGVHQWGIGANDREVIARLAQPFGDDQAIFTCNEAYSDYQGWVEGSLRSTNVMLEKGFDLDAYDKIFKAENSGISANAAAESQYDDKVKEMVIQYIIDEQTTKTPVIDLKKTQVKVKS
ncbi:amine oxidoreductase [Pseudoalteromonas sp. NBT06-2]|uniref:FAD-dependent oxidoreductase n=1 Tax=Pseudoalteromonas sp. NBT06-2 TaxID=2025950 RepID=UPI000BA5B1C5|nr:FAD-dependent oxidoreductase [Pseudoalteromonas sp. NBT06-2]PAJ76389.1 amine oxidoreductase [Pseudoalteromonas sp. NBT06-2]